MELSKMELSRMDLVKYVQITLDNIGMLDDFLKNKISSHFRYYNTRDVGKSVLQHTYTVIGIINGECISYGHLDYEECYWLGICILEPYQGKGYGTDMMNHLITMAKNKNIPEIHLTVDIDNIPAINLYHKLEFVNIDTNSKHIRMLLKIDKNKDYVVLPVSYGEAFDKLSILEIKLDKLKDDRRKDSEKEYNIILGKIIHLMNDDVKFHYNILHKSNLAIWDMQDEFRYNNGGSELCDKIILENDRRFRIKNKINNLLKSGIMEQKGYVKRKVFVLTHLGLGDNIAMIGMLRYLSTIYEEVMVVCKRKYQKNVELIFSDDKIIKFYPVEDDKNISPKFGFPVSEFNKITEGYNVIKVGFHGDKRIYDIPFCFYEHVPLSPKYFWKYFHIPDTKESDDLYNLVKGREYVVVHSKYSRGTVFNISSVEQHLGKNRNEILILDLDQNIYDKDHRDYELVQNFVFKMLAYYKKILINASALYLSDSCVFCMAVNLEINTDKCYYISRKDNVRDYSYFYNNKYGYDTLNRKRFISLKLI